MILDEIWWGRVPGVIDAYGNMGPFLGKAGNIGPFFKKRDPGNIGPGEHRHAPL